MIGDFKFNSVGQGLFYSGIITNANEEIFSLVYDCGATANYLTNLSSEIKAFHQEIKNNTIDLLVISHFDYDHISGLQELIKGKIVKNIVLPYYNTLELKLMEIKHVINGSNNSEYLKFLDNPIDYFQVNDSKIILMGGTEESDINLKEYETVKEYSENNCTGAKIIITVDEWEFLFYNKTQKTTQKVIDYVQEVKNKIVTKGSLENVLLDRNELKYLKSKTPFSTSNSNSIIMYHAPAINNVRRATYCYCQKCCRKCFCRCYPDCSGNLLTGTLLTGDMGCLKTEMKNITAYITRKRHDNISIFQVPHHGAYTKFSNFNYLHNVISYGLNNTHRHPNATTLGNIVKSGGHLHFVNENYRFSYKVR